MNQMVAGGMAIPLAKRPNSFLFRSQPSDVARIESRTYISTANRDDAGPTNNWVDPGELKATMKGLYQGLHAGPHPVRDPLFHGARSIRRSPRSASRSRTAPTWSATCTS